MKVEDLKSNGFKYRSEGFYGKMVKRGLWLELNLKDKRLILFDNKKEYVTLRYIKNIEGLNKLYEVLSSKQ